MGFSPVSAHLLPSYSHIYIDPMRKPKRSRTVYLGIFFFTLMIINIVYASLSNMNGVRWNGIEVDIPVELLILNAFMLGFIANILSDKIKNVLKRINP